MSLVVEEPGCDVTSQACIKAEADWCDWAVRVQMKQEPVENRTEVPSPEKADAPCAAGTCAGYCRRGALLDHTYATPDYSPPANECAKPEPAEGRAWAALYSGHAVKGELVLGPERVQRPREPAAARECFNPLESPAASERAPARPALKECSVRLERVPHRGPTRALGSDSDRDTPATPATSDSNSGDRTYIKVDYERDPMCDVCGRRFAWKSDLMDHVAVHIHVPTCAGRGEGGGAGQGEEEGVVADDYENDDLPRYLWRWARLVPRDCRVRLERCDALRPPRRTPLHAANTYACDICGETFRRKRILIRHIEMHAEMYLNCKFKVIHKRIHAVNGRYSCKCKKEFKILKHLLIHIRIRTGGKLYSCATCKKIFPWQIDLKRHTRIHTGEKPFSCEICQRKFIQLGTLKRHKAHVHNEGKIKTIKSTKAKCEICNKWVTNYRIHKFIHTGEKPYSCEVCGNSFSQLGTLIAHRRIHTGEKPYPCKMCKKRFRKLSDLYRHKRTHTGEMRHPCEICGEQFFRLYCLTEHLRIHTGEKQTCKSSRPRKTCTSPLAECVTRKSSTPRETSTSPLAECVTLTRKSSTPRETSTSPLAECVTRKRGRPRKWPTPPPLNRVRGKRGRLRSCAREDVSRDVKEDLYMNDEVTCERERQGRT